AFAYAPQHLGPPIPGPERRRRTRRWSHQRVRDPGAARGTGELDRRVGQRCHNRRGHGPLARPLHRRGPHHRGRAVRRSGDGRGAPVPLRPEGRYSLGWREVAGENRMAHSGTHTGHLAYQTVTEDGLGVAVMSNGLTASYDTVQPLAVGLLDLAEGESAEQPLPVPRLIDYG